MIKIDEKKNCCGCESCRNICPANCITMESDCEGFLYPHVDSEKCVGCHFCEKVCPFTSTHKQNIIKKAFAFKNDDELVFKQSSSGGAFTALAKAVLHKGGVVFGAAFDCKNQVRHILVDDENGLERLRGSKYVQSMIGNCFVEVKRNLDEGKTVLFSGTPCQVNGLHLFLNKIYDNLISVDFICHGVPSQSVFSKYLEYIQGRLQSHISKVVFRNKEYQTNTHTLSLSIESIKGKKYIGSSDIDPYYILFLKNVILRPSCYDCKAKGNNRYADITISDFWGVTDCCSEFDRNDSVSLVMINTEKGSEIFDLAKGKSKCVEVDAYEALKYNSSYSVSAEIPSIRKNFFCEFERDSFRQLIHHFGKPSIGVRITRIFYVLHIDGILRGVKQWIMRRKN